MILRIANSVSEHTVSYFPFVYIVATLLAPLLGFYLFASKDPRKKILGGILIFITLIIVGCLSFVTKDIEYNYYGPKGVEKRIIGTDYYLSNILTLTIFYYGLYLQFIKKESPYTNFGLILVLIGWIMFSIIVLIFPGVGMI